MKSESLAKVLAAGLPESFKGADVRSSPVGPSVFRAFTVVLRTSLTSGSICQQVKALLKGATIEQVSGSENNLNTSVSYHVQQGQDLCCFCISFALEPENAVKISVYDPPRQIEQQPTLKVRRFG